MGIAAHYLGILALDLGCHGWHADESNARHPLRRYEQSAAVWHPHQFSVPKNELSRENHAPPVGLKIRPAPSGEDPVCLGTVEEPDMDYLWSLRPTQSRQQFIQAKLSEAIPSATLPSRETSSKFSSLCPSTMRFA